MPLYAAAIFLHILRGFRRQAIYQPRRRRRDFRQIAFSLFTRHISFNIFTLADSYSPFSEPDSCLAAAIYFFAGR